MLSPVNGADIQEQILLEQFLYSVFQKELYNFECLYKFI
jgi:hypothetical protein